MPIYHSVNNRKERHNIEESLRNFLNLRFSIKQKFRNKATHHDYPISIPNVPVATRKSHKKSLSTNLSKVHNINGNNSERNLTNRTSKNSISTGHSVSKENDKAKERIQRWINDKAKYSIKLKGGALCTSKSTPYIPLCSDRESQKVSRQISNIRKAKSLNIIRQRNFVIKSSNYYTNNFSLNPKNSIHKTENILLSNLINIESMAENTLKLPRFVKQETRIQNLPIRATRRSEPYINKDKMKITLRDSKYKDSSIVKTLGKLDKAMNKLKRVRLASLDIDIK